MTKPLPTGCIKKEKTPKLKTVDLGNPIGDLFVCDTHFVHKRASAKQVLYNEILPLIIRENIKLLIPEEGQCISWLNSIQKPTKEFLIATAPYEKLTRLFFSKDFNFSTLIILGF